MSTKVAPATHRRSDYDFGHWHSVMERVNDQRGVTYLSEWMIADANGRTETI
jgi:hypothetical protein